MLQFVTHFEVKSLDEKGRFTGYGAVFGNIDRVGDVIEPGAFDATIAQHKAAGTMPSMYWHHNPALLIGDWLDWSVDTKGLLTEGQLFMDRGIPDAERAFMMLKGRARKGESIGYRTKRKGSKIVEGKSIRLLQELDVEEISLTPSPINTEATVFSIKSLEQALTIRDIEEHLRDVCGLSASESKGLISHVKKIVRGEREADEHLDSAAELLKSMNSRLDSIIIHSTH